MSESKSNSLWGVFKSVAASMFGVQSHQNYEYDFQQKSFVPYLLVGIVFVIGLILGLVIIVNIALG